MEGMGSVVWSEGRIDQRGKARLDLWPLQRRQANKMYKPRSQGGGGA